MISSVLVISPWLRACTDCDATATGSRHDGSGQLSTYLYNMTNHLLVRIDRIDQIDLDKTETRPPTPYKAADVLPVSSFLSPRTCTQRMDSKEEKKLPYSRSPGELVCYILLSSLL